jgi:hypothetical protein
MSEREDLGNAVEKGLHHFGVMETPAPDVELPEPFGPPRGFGELSAWSRGRTVSGAGQDLGEIQGGGGV